MKIYTLIEGQDNGFEIENYRVVSSYTTREEAEKEEIGRQCLHPDPHYFTHISETELLSNFNPDEFKNRVEQENKRANKPIPSPFNEEWKANMQKAYEEKYKS
jgi:hypothetical protein